MSYHENIHRCSLSFREPQLNELYREQKLGLIKNYCLVLGLGRAADRARDDLGPHPQSPGPRHRAESHRTKRRQGDEGGRPPTQVTIRRRSLPVPFWLKVEG